MEYLSKFEFVLAQVTDEVDHEERGQVSQICTYAEDCESASVLKPGLKVGLAWVRVPGVYVERTSIAQIENVQQRFQ